MVPASYAEKLIAAYHNGISEAEKTALRYREMDMEGEYERVMRRVAWYQRQIDNLERKPERQDHD